MASLNLLTQPKGTSPNGDPTIHPDGGMFPGPGLRIGDFTDGLAHTILCTETMDDTQSVWTLGTDATLVGLPYSGKGGSANAGNGAIPSFSPMKTNATWDGPALSYDATGLHGDLRR